MKLFCPDSAYTLTLVASPFSFSLIVLPHSTGLITQSSSTVSILLASLAQSSSGLFFLPLRPLSLCLCHQLQVPHFLSQACSSPRFSARPPPLLNAHALPLSYHSPPWTPFSLLRWRYSRVNLDQICHPRHHNRLTFWHQNSKGQKLNRNETELLITVPKRSKGHILPLHSQPWPNHGLRSFTDPISTTTLKHPFFFPPTRHCTPPSRPFPDHREDNHSRLQSSQINRLQQPLLWTSTYVRVERRGQKNTWNAAHIPSRARTPRAGVNCVRAGHQRQCIRIMEIDGGDLRRASTLFVYGPTIMSLSPLANCRVACVCVCVCVTLWQTWSRHLNLDFSAMK